MRKNNKVFKLNFWKKIFWSSKRIQEKFELNQKDIINDLNNQMTLLQNNFNNLKDNFQKLEEQKDLLIDEKQKFYSENLNYKKDLEQKNNDLNNLKDKITEIKEKLARESEKLNSTTSENAKILAEKNQIQKTLDKLKNENNDLINEKDSLSINLNDKLENLNLLKNEISNKLDPLKTIKDTFFAHNKGLGILGEMKLKNSLIKSGIDKDLWVENLMIGKEQVEFAFKSGVDDNKYIPVDSKVIQYTENEENQIVITPDYLTKIRTQSKKISKYLNKKNTTNYGIMVLQSDELYLRLFNDNPELFYNSINENHIYIFGTSSFIQFAIFMQYIIDISKKLETVKSNFKLIEEYINITNKFHKSSSEGYKHLHTAFKTHWNAIEKKANVVNELVNNKKLLTDAKSEEINKKLDN